MALFGVTSLYLKGTYCSTEQGHNLIMTIKCNIFLEDIQLIHKHIDHFRSMFPIEIKSKSLIPDDDGTSYEGEPDDLFEVEFEMNNMNNFWFMGQLIGEIKYKNKLTANE